MTAADIRRLLLLAALWGGSFLFIRIVVPVLGPVVTVETRVVIAGLTLLVLRRWRTFNHQIFSAKGLKLDSISARIFGRIAK